MKTSKAIILTAICLSVLLSLTVPTALARPGEGPHGRNHPPLHELLGDLGLSDLQQSAVEQLIAERRSGRQDDMQQARAAHDGLREAVHAEPFDEQAIRAAAAAVAALELERALERAAFLQELRTILTPEQAEQLEQKMQDMRENRRHGRREGRGGPDQRPRRGLEG